MPDIPQYRKRLTACHKLEAATHGHLGTEPGNHRHVSTRKQERVGSRLLAMTAVLSVDTFLGKRLYLK